MTATQPCLYEIGVAEGVLPAKYRPAFYRYRAAHAAWWSLEGARNREAKIAASPAAQLYETLQGNLPRLCTIALDTLCNVPVRNLTERDLRNALYQFEHRFVRALGHLHDRIGLKIVDQTPAKKERL